MVLGEFLELLDDRFLDFLGGDVRGEACLAAALERMDANVEPVALAALLGGKRWRHGEAARLAAQDAFEQRVGFGAGTASVALPTEQVLDLLPYHRVDNGLVLAGVKFFLVLDLSQVDGVGQQVVQAALGKPLPAPKMPF